MDVLCLGVSQVQKEKDERTVHKRVISVFVLFFYIDHQCA